jgi:hypothetical protein
MNTSPSSHLTDDELVAAVKHDAQGTRASIVALIVHLAELASRRLHLAAGFGSLFRYCRQELRLSRLAPKPDAPTTIRKVPDRPPAGPTPPPRSAASLATPAVPQSVPADDSSISPLSPGRWRVAFTADEEMRDLILMAREMMSHANPKGDSKEIFRRALKALARDLARDPSAAVQREVWVRDGGRWRFVAKDGRRCSERRFLQFHHSRKPYALGGAATQLAVDARRASQNFTERTNPRNARALSSFSWPAVFGPERRRR